MNKIILEIENVIRGYETVSTLYPFIPSINFWRAFEYASYRRYKLSEPVLDIGCGDGRFFNLVWPELKQVTGIDIEPSVIPEAQKIGVYERLITMQASDLKFPDASFASVFANCALEHMDDIDKVLSEIYRVLQLDGDFLFSIVTDKFLEWTNLPLILNKISGKEEAQFSITEFIEYHHLRNAFHFEEWVNHTKMAGFEIVEYIPILPENTSRLFLFMDQIWHLLASDDVELGQHIKNYLEKYPNFPKAMCHILTGCLEMENDMSSSSGVVFWAKKV